MRLVLLVPQFPKLSETFIVSKFLGLLDAGWDVHVACRVRSNEQWAAHPDLAKRPELKDRVHPQWRHQPRWVAVFLWPFMALLTFWRAPRTSLNYLRRGWPLFGLPLLKQFYLDAAIIAVKPDIVHFEFATLSVGRTYLKELLDCRMTASHRGYDITYVGLDDPDYYTPLWQKADALHLLGEDLWQRALRRGCPPDKPHAYISPAINAQLFDRGLQDSNDQYAVIGPERPLRILSVGRMEWMKGYEFGLAAVRQLVDQGIPVEYRIIGGGAYMPPVAYARHEMALEPYVQLLGPKNRATVLEHLRWADIFLHAAVSEGFCNAVIEAQAMQVPVVTTDADGLPENVEDGVTGFAVPRRHAAPLAEKLAVLAGDPELRRSFGQAGRDRVTLLFQLRDQIKAFDFFYRQVGQLNAH